MKTLLLFLLSIALARATDPLAVFLTWKDDPCTTMVVDCHLPEKSSPPEIQYRRKGESAWAPATSKAVDFPYSKRTIFRSPLAGLTPDSTYEFRFAKDGRTFSFRTMPRTLTRPVRFAAGGDTMHQEDWMEKTNGVALAADPDFVVWGGDLSYDDGEAGKVDRVLAWFDACNKTLISPEGRVVPVLVAIGNHEVRGGFINSFLATYIRETRRGMSESDFRSELAPYFFSVYAFPAQPGYGVLDFGDYLSLVLLDSNHTNRVDGSQAEWLQKTLADRRDRPNVFPIYHVPAYPSVRPFDEPVCTLVRQTWVPIFEKNGVRVVFENHDHAYKRTKPLRGGKVEEGGIVFVGDGAWGVETREPRANEWYLEKATQARHCLIVTLDKSGRKIEARSADGTTLDEFAY